MSDPSIGTAVSCRQCAAPLAVEQDSPFVTCGFCGATNFVDKSRAVFHYTARSTVDEPGALSALRRWMAGNDTVKDLDRKASVDAPTFEYFPMWLVRSVQGGQELVRFRPAAAISVSALNDIRVPAADLVPYDPDVAGRLVAPTVPYEAALEWLADDHVVALDSVREVSLVHLPIYLCKYTFGGRRFMAVVDGATGKVFANIYPAKWETPYVTLGVLAFVAYFVLAIVSLEKGFSVYSIGAPLLALPFLLVALLISARV